MKSELQIALEELDKSLNISLDNQRTILKAQVGIKNYISDINKAHRRTCEAGGEKPKNLI